MKLKTYIRFLKQLIDNNPGSKNMDVIYSIDEEGNEFKEVSFPPSIGKYKKESFNPESRNPNAICIN